MIQGQYTITLASDPFGRGWDLLGTADYAPHIAPFSPNTVWYVQFGSLVAATSPPCGRARPGRLDPPRRDVPLPVRMLALMVLYTVGGLWLLSRG